MIELTSAQLDAWIAAFLPVGRIPAFWRLLRRFRTRQCRYAFASHLAWRLRSHFAPAAKLSSHRAGVRRRAHALAQQMLIGLTMGFAMRLAVAVVDFAVKRSAFRWSRLRDFLRSGQYLADARRQWFLSAGAIDPVFDQRSPDDPRNTRPEFLRASRRRDFVGRRARGPTWPMPGHHFATGLLLALPVVCAMLITNIALGVLTRAAPQLNLFAVGFPFNADPGVRGADPESRLSGDANHPRYSSTDCNPCSATSSSRPASAA